MLSFVEAANLQRSMFWLALASYDRMVCLIQIKTKTNGSEKCVYTDREATQSEV